MAQGYGSEPRSELDDYSESDTAGTLGYQGKYGFVNLDPKKRTETHRSLSKYGDGKSATFGGLKAFNEGKGNFVYAGTGKVPDSALPALIKKHGAAKLMQMGILHQGYSGFTQVGKAAELAGKYVAKGASEAYKVAGPIIQTALKNMGPIGMVASAALGVMAAGLSGKSLKDIALAAAVGALPSGLDKAVSIALSGNKEALLGEVVSQVGGAFLPGTAEALGFNKALDALKKGASVADLSVLKGKLKLPGEIKAFEAAIGAVAKKAQSAVNLPKVQLPKVTIGGVKLEVPKLPSGVKMPSKLSNASNMIRRNLRPGVNVSRPTSRPLVVQKTIAALPFGVRAPLQAISRDPSLAMNVQALAAKLGTRTSSVNRAIGISKGVILPYRSLNRHGIRFAAPYFKNIPKSVLGRDVGALTDNGKVYIIEKGDGMAKMIANITGITSGKPLANAMAELVAANPIKGTKYNAALGWKEFNFFNTGEKINVPSNWIKAQPAPVVEVVKPVPVVSPVVVTKDEAAIPVEIKAQPAALDPTVTASLLQAKGLLVAWGKTDGKNEAGIPDYGTKPEDMVPQWGSRDSFVMKSFENWYNKTQQGGLTVNGNVDPESLEALRSWAEKKGAQSAGSGIPGGDPISMTPKNLPPDVTTPVTIAPGPLPAEIIPAAPIAIPTGAIVLPGGETITVTPKSPTSAPAMESQGSAAPMIVGAIAGGLIGGPLGAVIGGGVGLAIGGKETPKTA